MVCWMDGQTGRGMNGFSDGRMDFAEESSVGVGSPRCTETAHSPERMKKMPETKARMVLCGRTCPMLLRINPMNMKKRLTRGNGVAERIISDGGDKRPPSAQAPSSLPNLLRRGFLAVSASCQVPRAAPAGAPRPAPPPAVAWDLPGICPLALSLWSLC